MTVRFSRPENFTPTRHRRARTLSSFEKDRSDHQYLALRYISAEETRLTFAEQVLFPIFGAQTPRVMGPSIGYRLEYFQFKC